MTEARTGTTARMLDEIDEIVASAQMLVVALSGWLPMPATARAGEGPDPRYHDPQTVRPHERLGRQLNGSHKVAFAQPEYSQVSRGITAGLLCFVKDDFFDMSKNVDLVSIIDRPIATLDTRRRPVGAASLS